MFSIPFSFLCSPINHRTHRSTNFTIFAKDCSVLTLRYIYLLWNFIFFFLIPKYPIFFVDFFAVWGYFSLEWVHSFLVLRILFGTHFILFILFKLSMWSFCYFTLKWRSIIEVYSCYCSFFLLSWISMYLNQSICKEGLFLKIIWDNCRNVPNK